MSDEKLSFLDEKPKSDTEDGEAVEPRAEAPDAAKAEPKGAEQPKPQEGKGEQEPNTETDQASAKPDEKGKGAEPGFVPIEGLLNEREKRQELERRLKEIEQTQQQAKTKAPDMFDDPEGWQRQMEEQQRNLVLNTKLELSADYMREQLGEQFDEVAKWWASYVEKNPHELQRGIQQPNPWRYAHQQFRKHKVMEEVGDDPAAYRERLRAEIRAEIEAEQAQAVEQTAQAPASQTPKRQPPPSLANKPSASNAKSIPVGPGHAFDNVIG